MAMVDEWFDLLNEKFVRSCYASVWYGSWKPTLKAGKRSFAYLQRLRSGRFEVAGTLLELDENLPEDCVECVSTANTGWAVNETHSCRIVIPDEGV